MTAKKFYSTYIADDSWSVLSGRLIEEINAFEPVHALEFGSGSGKHLAELYCNDVVGCGLDISIGNLHVSHYKNDNKFLILGDETHLRHLCNFDVVFTCSVLDHIEDIDGIVKEFKRIANKAIVIAETCDVMGEYYWAHDYESMGFRKLDFHWHSEGDGANYYIWVFEQKF